MGSSPLLKIIFNAPTSPRWLLYISRLFRKEINSYLMIAENKRYQSAKGTTTGDIMFS